MDKPKLRQPVNIPGVSAHLVAYYRSCTRDELDERGIENTIRNLTDPSIHVVDWLLTLYISGPDSRYAPGSALVDSSEIPNFLEALQQAQAKMKVLAERQFGGSYSSRIELKGKPRLEVGAHNGEVHLSLGLPSSTGNTWHQKFSLEQVSNLISTIADLPTEGAFLMKTLEELP